jgi:Rieske Fe-S protein
MKPSCRAFVVLAFAGVFGCAGNPAPVFEADINHSIPLPPALSDAGAQVKVVLPQGGAPVLVWRTEIGFGGASIRCTCCGGDLVYRPERSTLECPQGSRFDLDGSVKTGRARKPLRAYVVDREGDRLKILG